MKKNPFYTFIILIIACPLIFLSKKALPETLQEKGLAIAREEDRRDQGFGDYIVDMKMTLRNRHGQESVRIIRFNTLEVIDDGDKSLTVFDTPRDIKGTAFLNYTHKTGDDDQWLYLPALKRVKRISSSNKSGSFMGSEFSYEDISSQEVEKYTYKWIRDEIYKAQDCFVVERYPIDQKDSGYTKQIVWIDKDEYRKWKIDFYDRKKSLLKTLNYSDYNQYLGKYWRAHSLNMVNHQNGKSTQLDFSNYSFQTGLTDEDFNQSSLKRSR